MRNHFFLFFNLFFFLFLSFSFSFCFRYAQLWRRGLLFSQNPLINCIGIEPDQRAARESHIHLETDGRNETSRFGLRQSSEMRERNLDHGHR
ncbi:hypothetical protein BKA67DRAFT_577418 [Truncatella angustata]|uniref:Uncharacterized protein n=1 Tax=Truncatella angustata TaxID=152316 RepID=A0A9P8UD02_9PEZI|nr:uncharacterized protein BKA67DRAFT_577418 [Truncatella angustata]KAH6647423.1 hypothetical protein BKA67DRAFT_577418 [Truncatella angustata]